MEEQVGRRKYDANYEEDKGVDGLVRFWDKSFFILLDCGMWIIFLWLGFYSE